MFSLGLRDTTRCPDITEQIEAESCSHPAVCSTAPRECGPPSSQQTLFFLSPLPPSPLLALFLPSTVSFIPRTSRLFSRLFSFSVFFLCCPDFWLRWVTPNLTPADWTWTSQPRHSSQSSTRPPLPVPTAENPAATYTGATSPRPRGWRTLCSSFPLFTGSTILASASRGRKNDATNYNCLPE